MSMDQPDGPLHKQERTDQLVNYQPNPTYQDVSTFAVSTYLDNFLTFLSLKDLLRASCTCFT